MSSGVYQFQDGLDQADDRHVDGAQLWSSSPVVMSISKQLIDQLRFSVVQCRCSCRQNETRKLLIRARRNSDEGWTSSQHRESLESVQVENVGAVDPWKPPNVKWRECIRPCWAPPPCWSGDALSVHRKSAEMVSRQSSKDCCSLMFNILMVFEWRHNHAQNETSKISVWKSVKMWRFTAHYGGSAAL